MTKFTVALREIGMYKEVLRSQVCSVLGLSYLSVLKNDNFSRISTGWHLGCSS